MKRISKQKDCIDFTYNTQGGIIGGGLHGFHLNECVPGLDVIKVNINRVFNPLRLWRLWSILHVRDQFLNS